jgi:hypothetical protein
MAGRPCVFIHTNDKQILGALVSRYSFSRFASDPSAFDVRLVEARDHRLLLAHEGRRYLRDGLRRTWINEDLQSFTVLRFAPPEIMGYRGRALVVDPDVFAVADVGALLQRDMQGAAIVARRRPGPKLFASSVMLLDNAKLTHWRLAENFEEMFAFERDYADWIGLRLEPPDTIGPLEREWNDFDTLTANTRLLHNTRRRTQPWKSGLPVDFRAREAKGSFRPGIIYHRLRRRLFGEHAFMGRYQRHPDPRQERLFFSLLRECVDRRVVPEEVVRDEIRSRHVRPDALAMLEKVPPLRDAVMEDAPPALRR